MPRLARATSIVTIVTIGLLAPQPSGAAGDGGHRPPSPRLDAARGDRGFPAATGPLGRLFLSPAERRRIDAGVAPSDPVAVADPADATAPPGPVRVDGWLHRADGSEVVWLDGRANELREIAAGSLRARVGVDGPAVTVRRPGAPTATLRPGQTSDRDELGAGNRVEVLR